MPPKDTRTLPQKLADYTDRSGGPDSCWEWTGARMPRGYGAIRMPGRIHGYAHRAAWIAEYGPIPIGMCVCHRCDNPPCCNPSHLFLGTRADNAADREAKGRGIPGMSPGSLNPAAKLNDDMVRQIRDLRSQGMEVTQIAERYGITKAAISKVVLRRTWKHVA